MDLQPREIKCVDKRGEFTVTIQPCVSGGFHAFVESEARNRMGMVEASE